MFAQLFVPIFPYRISFSILWTRQYNFHCVSTLRRPRSVKRFSRLFWRSAGSRTPA
jgi:hypothetical protein